MSSSSFILIITRPCAILQLVSKASKILLRSSLFTNNLSIKTKISSFIFFSKFISSAALYMTPFTFILVKPLLLKSSIKSLCVPFSPLITGANISILLFSSKSNTLLVISSILWLFIGILCTGQYGVPILENNNLK